MGKKIDWCPQHGYPLPCYKCGYKRATVWDIIADTLLIMFGCFLVYVFVVIEIQGKYGQEANQYIRWVEIAMGLPVIALGVYRYWNDWK